jgi:transcriptional regulator with XRE-family HTH domain
MPSAAAPQTSPGDQGTITEDQTSVRAWLRAQRLARGWSVAEMGRQLGRASKTSGDHTVPSAAILASYVRRWEQGKIDPTERYRLHYCTALALDPSQFGPQDPPAPVNGAASATSASTDGSSAITVTVTIQLPPGVAGVLPRLETHD